MTLLATLLLFVGAWVVAGLVWRKTELPPFFAFLANRFWQRLAGFLVLSGLVVLRIVQEPEQSWPIHLVILSHQISVMIWLGLSLGLGGAALLAGKREKGSLFREKALSLFPLLWVAVLVTALSGGVASLLYFSHWSQILETRAGFKLLIKTVLFLAAFLLLVLVWLRFTEGEREQGKGPPLGRTEENFQWEKGRFLPFLAASLLLTAGLGAAAFLPGDPPLIQGDVHKHDEPFQFYFRHDLTGDGAVELMVYVLHERKRTSVSSLYFDAWPDERHEEVSQLFDTICIALNLGLDAWREALVERGFVASSKGEEQETGVYTTTFRLSPGLWHVRVHAQEGELETFRDYTLVIPEKGLSNG